MFFFLFLGVPLLCPLYSDCVDLRLKSGVCQFSPYFWSLVLILLDCDNLYPESQVLDSQTRNSFKVLCRLQMLELYEQG